MVGRTGGFAPGVSLSKLDGTDRFQISGEAAFNLSGSRSEAGWQGHLMAHGTAASPANRAPWAASATREDVEEDVCKGSGHFR